MRLLSLKFVAGLLVVNEENGVFGTTSKIKKRSTLPGGALKFAAAPKPRLDLDPKMVSMSFDGFEKYTDEQIESKFREKADFMKGIRDSLQKKGSMLEKIDAGLRAQDPRTSDAFEKDVRKWFLSNWVTRFQSEVDTSGASPLLISIGHRLRELLKFMGDEDTDSIKKIEQALDMMNPKKTP
jgi:hypothetical protein